MSLKKNLAITLGTVGLITGSLWVAEPHLTQGKNTLDQVQQDTSERKEGDLSDANDMSKDRYRDEANDLVDAENERKNTPGEVRPKIKLRLP